MRKRITTIGITLLVGLFFSAFNAQASGDPVLSDNKPVKITDANIDDMISEGVVLVDFWAIWCRPCRMMTPIIDSLAVKMDGRATIGKLDVDHNRLTSQRYGIRSIPTIIIFKDGKAVKRFIGVTSEATLMAALEELVPPLSMEVPVETTPVAAPADSIPQVINKPGRIMKKLPDPKNPGNAPTSAGIDTVATKQTKPALVPSK